jgi:hypothetical protein
MLLIMGGGRQLLNLHLDSEQTGSGNLMTVAALFVMIGVAAPFSLLLFSTPGSNAPHRLLMQVYRMCVLLSRINGTNFPFSLGLTRAAAFIAAPSS